MSTPVNNRSELLKFPNSYAFVIGINYYPLINGHLLSAVPDAKAIARVLKEQQGFDHVELFMGVAPQAPKLPLLENLEGIDMRMEQHLEVCWFA